MWQPSEAAAAAATDVSPRDFRNETYSTLRPTTTDTIPEDPLEKLGDIALRPSLRPPTPLPFSFRRPAASALQPDAGVTLMRPDGFELQPTQWMACQHFVNVPEADLLHPLGQARSRSAELNSALYLVDPQNRQPAGRHRVQGNKSIQTHGTPDVRLGGELYISNEYIDSIKHSTIKSTDQFHQLSGSPFYGVLETFPQSLSTKSLELLPSWKSESQPQYGLSQASSTPVPRTRALFLDDLDSLATSNYVSPLAPAMIPQETLLPQVVHAYSKHNIGTIPTTQTQLVSQNDPSVGYSDRNILSAVYWPQALQDDSQCLGPYATTSVGSIDRGSVSSNLITPRGDDTRQQSESQSETTQGISSRSFNIAPSYRASSHQRDDRCKSKQLCAICSMSFTLRASLKRHEKEMHQHEGEYWCPPIGLVTKGNGNGVCAICNYSDPDVDHFVTTHGFKKCYQATKFGTRRRFKRKDRFIKHLKGHDIYEGSLCLNRNLRYAKNKSTYGCGYCPTMSLDWTGYQENLTDHLKDTIILPWDNSVVLEVLLSQDFVRGPWRKFLCGLFSEGRPSQRLTWPEKETEDLQSSLEDQQASAHAEELAWKALTLTEQWPWIRSTLELRRLNPFGHLDAAPVLNNQEDCDFLGPAMRPRQNQSADALLDLSLHSNAFGSNDVSDSTRTREDHSPGLPFGIDTAGNDDMEWSYNGSPTALY
ncbi:hypothetical protein MMC27_002116 [Xylographa pallens]|nr:hypothetical protein [Xylographa pallens]